MKNQTTNFFSITLSVATLFAFVACAKSSGGDNSAAAAAGGSTSSTSTVNASCNGFDSSSGVRLTGRIATYYDSSNTFVEDKLRVRVTSLTSAFDTNGYTLQLFRWKADSSGATALDSTPLSFTVYYGSTAISSAMTSIDSATVTSLRNQSHIGNSTSDFFNQTQLVVSGVDNSWEVLKVVLYDGSQAIAQTDSLMPLFIANPTTYAANHAAVLAGLHPFYADRSNGYTDAQWVSLSNKYCF